MNLKSRAKKPLFVVIQVLAVVQIIAIILNVFFGYFYTIENANFITNFADYHRGNMDFASLNTTIPFEKELNHTRIYTEIEALRFNNIKFEFNIEDKDFEIPALTVQPMVENAVRHGVRSKPDAHILIHTYAEENYHVVVINDNGKGFDNAQFNGSRTHIGLLNTRLCRF